MISYSVILHFCPRSRMQTLEAIQHLTFEKRWLIFSLAVFIISPPSHLHIISCVCYVHVYIYTAHVNLTWQFIDFDANWCDTASNIVGDNCLSLLFSWLLFLVRAVVLSAAVQKNTPNRKNRRRCTKLIVLSALISLKNSWEQTNTYEIYIL